METSRYDPYWPRPRVTDILPDNFNFASVDPDEILTNSDIDYAIWITSAYGNPGAANEVIWQGKPMMCVIVDGINCYGRIVLCDPAQPHEKALSLKVYDCIVCQILDTTGSELNKLWGTWKSKVIATVLLLVDENEPCLLRYWSSAAEEGHAPKPVEKGEVFGYSSESGLGCFTSAFMIPALKDAWANDERPLREWYESEEGNHGPYTAYCAYWISAITSTDRVEKLNEIERELAELRAARIADGDEEFDELDELDREIAELRDEKIEVLDLDREDDSGVAMFRTPGVGIYPCLYGYDETGKVKAVVTYADPLDDPFGTGPYLGKHMNVPLKERSFLLSIQRGDVDILRQFLDEQAYPVNEEYEVENGNERSRKTPLMIAVEQGNKETVELLLSHDALIDDKVRAIECAPEIKALLS